MHVSLYLLYLLFSLANLGIQHVYRLFTFCTGLQLFGRWCLMHSSALMNFVCCSALHYLGTQHAVCLITVCFCTVTAFTIVLYFGRSGKWSFWLHRMGVFLPWLQHKLCYKLCTWVGDKEPKPNTCAILLMTLPMCYLSFATNNFTIYLDVPV